MKMKYRVVFESYTEGDEKKSIERNIVIEDEFKEVNNLLDFSMGQQKQLELIRGAQDNFFKERDRLLNKKESICPKCESRLIKFGHNITNFHDLYTDHKIKIQRMKCAKCKYELASSVKATLNTEISADLARVQATLGATKTYRDGERTLSLFSGAERAINNHDRIKHVTEVVGEVVGIINDEEKEMIKSENAKELILNVDGGHIKTIEDKRSIEAITSVIYNPISLKSNPKGTRNYIESKRCAASIKEDNQVDIISNTIVAALKQGIGKDTHIIGLSDGSANCWNVIDAIEPLCVKMTRILDWFHIAMKIENISLPTKLKEKLICVKWHLWRGKVDNALIRLDQLIELAKGGSIDKIKKFKNYISNNKEKIVDYRSRKKEGRVFTSNLAESTVESLINKRCKGQQHMRWSREGLNPILQLRAVIHSNDWDHKWKDAILNAFETS